MLVHVCHDGELESISEDNFRQNSCKVKKIQESSYTQYLTNYLLLGSYSCILTTIIKRL